MTWRAVPLFGLVIATGALPAAAASHPSPRRATARRSVRRPAASTANPGRSGLPAAACAPATGTEKAALEIPDLKTAEHVAAVVSALERLKGVKSAIVDLNTRLAVVDYDPHLTELPHFLD